MKHLLFIFLMLLGVITLSAQKINYYSAEKREADYKNEMKEKLAIDYSMPDYATKKLDAKVMGDHMATMVNIFLERSTQLSYQRPLNKIIGEQVEPLKYYDYGIKKIDITRAEKKGNEITLQFKVWLSKKTNGIKQTEMTIRFTDGVSDNEQVNYLFDYINRSAQKLFIKQSE